MKIGTRVELWRTSPGGKAGTIVGYESDDLYGLLYEVKWDDGSIDFCTQDAVVEIEPVDDVASEPGEEEV